MENQDHQELVIIQPSYAPRQHFLSRPGRNQQYPPRSNRFYKNQQNQVQTKKKFMRT